LQFRTLQLSLRDTRQEKCQVISTMRHKSPVQIRPGLIRTWFKSNNLGTLREGKSAFCNHGVGIGIF
jgi:hypothetical protein